ncbi:MAG: diaminopimelate epimerase [Candidatus Gracilibacteria bacterium]|jgi:diaminopimelate epimerase|nr:diaminopimelate epimerase [Candidatus Gracilibacteria bacterium]
MKFWKMQGIGNDFIVIDNMNGEINNIQKNAKFLCDRNFGIGADQILIAEKSDKADYFMRIFNADGSEVEMCGNGIRAITIFTKEQGICPKDEHRVDTLAGIKTTKIIGNLVKVNMGKAIFNGLSDFPDNFIQDEIKGCLATCVSVGNPHCVIKTDSVDEIELHKIGPHFENHRFFPNRINTEFVEIISPQELKMRVWERGSGETLACGTGATASCIAMIKNGFSPAKKDIKIHLKGGTLIINWDTDTNTAYMSGEAKKVFKGEIKLHNAK